MTVLTKKRNEIQWLRAIAACEVMVCHSDLIVKYFSPSRIILNPWYQPLAGVGVELFFIVSGYIMCMRAPEIGSYGAFLVSRIKRIYPMYWVFTTIAVFVGVTIPAWRLNQFDPDMATFARSYLVLPGWGFPILGVGWTLEYEMIFYALVSLAMAVGVTRGRRLATFTYFLAGLGFVGSLLGHQTEGSALRYHIFSPYMFAFGAGWLFRSIEQTSRSTQIRSIALFAAIAALAAWVATTWGDRLVFRMSVAALVFGFFLLARRVFQSDNLLNRTVWLVGDASFSLYLSHWFVLSSAGKLLGALAIPAGIDWLMRILCCLVSIAVGVWFFCYLEKPLDRWLRRQPATVRSARAAKQPGPGALPIR